MDKNSYEQKIQALEAEIKMMKERYQILVETTSAILFEASCMFVGKFLKI